MSQQAAFLVRMIVLHAWQPAMIAVLLTALIASAAQAYRPFDLTDADVAKRHNFEIELGPAELIGVDSEHSLRAPNLSINYGLATGRELVLEGANRVALKATPGEPRSSLEDVAFAMKQVLRRGSLQDESGLSVAMEDAILIPERGENHLGAAANLILSSASKRGTTHFNLEAERLPEARNAGSAGVIFEASDHFGIAPAIELKIEAVKGGPPEHSVIFGLIYVPGEEAEYDLAVRLAQAADERIFEIRAGLTWQMSLHKVLEKAGEVVGIPHPRRRRH
jgi:hypothetical protein